MKSIHIKRMATFATVLLLASLTACSSCQRDAQPNGARTETEPQSAQQPSSDTEYVTEPGMESGTEPVTADATEEDSQEATYNDYGEWDIP